MPVASRAPRPGGRRPCGAAMRLPEAPQARNAARPAGRKRSSAPAAPAVALKAPPEESAERPAGSDDAPEKMAARESAWHCAESRPAVSGGLRCLTWPPTATGRQPSTPRPGPCSAPLPPAATKSLGLRRRAVSRSHPSSCVPP